jgi:predicted secreted hydrolase
LWIGPVGSASITYPSVTPRPLVFPQDHGAHPDFRTEWWYLTGWLDERGGPSIGFQITFFRFRTPIAPSPSRFTANQLIIGHAAIADTARGALLHEERVQRAAFGLVGAAEGDTDVRLDRWRFVRDAVDGTYRSTIPARTFTLELTARPTQPLLLQGDHGYSRKGPLVEQASFYYSQPQLAVQATLTNDGVRRPLTGVAWLDHEWSTSVLDPGAAGWDWTGMNLDDGSALTAFEIRRIDRGPPLYRYASLRLSGGTVRAFGGDEVRFQALSTWRSPRTGATYPVAQRLTIGERVFETRPLMNDQELDSRASSGAVYWEGASELLESGRRAGRGYLEMTGYLAPMRL